MSISPSGASHKPGAAINTDQAVEFLRLLFAIAPADLQHLVWKVCGRRDRWLPKGRPSPAGLPDPHDGIGYDPLRGPIVGDDDPQDELLEDHQ
jgi:hypothetical protein